MSFEKLLEELEVMAKSIGEDDGDDDEAIQAAAEDGKEGEHAEPDGDEDGEVEGDGDGDEPMGKSFAFTLEDGTVVEAQDGTELVKSLMARIDTTESTIAKALGSAVELIGKQGDMIKSLQAEMKKMAGEGRGRKTVVSVAEKVPTGQTMAKSEPGMTVRQFFAKANAAFGAGKITGQELTAIDVSIRSGMEIDQGLVAKVFG